MKNNIKPIVKDNLYDASNFTDWISDEYGEMKCFLAYVDDNDALTRINEIKANFDENSTNQYLEVQVSFDKKGIIREVIMLIQEKIEDEWTDPERIGGHFFDSRGNVIGHEFLSREEFAELETLARQAYAAKYLIDTDSCDKRKMSYVLTLSGENKVKQFIAECVAKRKEILDVKLDTADETDFPTKEDIIDDLEFTGIDSDGEYCNGWGVTDHYDSDGPLSLTAGTDFIIISFG